MSYNDTLNLPKTDFPMRANLPKREPEILKFWEEIDIYRKVQEKNKGRKKFILHDGPPYANGNIHLGTTLNKILKDIVVKYHSMVGYDAPFVPGWDTHGLPIETQAIKNLGINRGEISVHEFRQKCKEYALNYVNIQREQFKRLGVRGDWDNPYLTLHPEFEAAQIGVFGEMARKGYIYKGLKPVYWCADCQTALAEAEVEYHDARSPSIYVKFPVVDGKGKLPEENCYVVIWTTTPWTLPANVAITLHPRYVYVLLEKDGEYFVMAKELYKKALEDMDITEEFKVVKEFQGKELEGVVCRNPLVDRDSLVILGEHVTLEQGTGCVHTAPGHGIEDYEVGQRYGLPIISPLDSEGKFTSEIKDLEGLPYFEANKVITGRLEENGSLMHLSFINHQYPHCWRCKHPVIFRATEQWFASIGNFRKELLEEIDRVKWIPSWGRERMHNMIAERGDWCISRQRTWGVPIPAFYCRSCGEIIITEETISHIQKLFKEHGSDIWFIKEAHELIPEGLKCHACGGGEFEKETDIMDVWFDSGSSHIGVLLEREELEWPADLYLEGSDQYRGWFNSSLSTGVAVKGKAPYKAVLTHGFLVDEQGRKMSKSLGNVIDPMDVIKSLGADILRLWVSSADYHKDIAVSDNIMKQIAEAYRKIRNTCRFLIGNLYDFTPGRDEVAYDDLLELDKWALLKLHKLIKQVTEAYSKYDFHRVYYDIHNFCVTDMSAFYLNILKDRLYTFKADSVERRAAQTVMYQILEVLVVLLAPILAFTTEEIWRYMPKKEGAPESVQLADWPKVNEKYLDADLEKRWDMLIEVREQVVDALEIARNDGLIRDSLEAKVELYPSRELYDFLKEYEKDLATLFIVSQVKLNDPEKELPHEVTRYWEEQKLGIKIDRAKGEKCERCWIYSETVGQAEKHPTICSRCVEVVESLK
ncbi:MAG TPA: isoleucine--tRNA ligase [Peptococcaceae bacterium]|nr:MAG: Isoleucine--tRNA ligase [Clostridia bacterium 41_269]HBT20090.1 isoleucine--tRNA ligase [Peptococcaceae bacterium]